jgi:hypothetical protein
MCLDSPGLLRLEFKTTLQDNAYTSYYKENLEKDFDFVSGNRVVVLNQSEYTCMIPYKGNYQYRERKFVINFESGGKLKQIPVAKGDIFHLCKNAGSWKRIQPIKIPPS